MSIEYIYQVFMIIREDEHLIRLTIAEDDTLMYQFDFAYKEECSNYLRILHNFAMEMQENNLSIRFQCKLLKDYIYKNPFNYEFDIQEI